jgi:diguanylate cyclase (GGDEF)-like protein/PAS domain S-box-containing protein
VRRQVAPRNAQPQKYNATADTTLQNIDRYLRVVQVSLGASVVYVLNSTGDCVASSNADQEDSFVGKNYASRTYFKQAMSGQFAQQYAFGKTSKMPGLYFSSPVTAAGHPVAVVTAKINLPSLSYWVNQANTFVTDQYGVIIIARDPKLEMRSLSADAVAVLSTSEKLERYKRSELPSLNFKPWGSQYFASLFQLDNTGPPLLMTERKLKNEGISIHVMEPVPELVEMTEERQRQFLLLDISGALALMLMGARINYLRTRRHSEKISRQQQAALIISENKLRGLFELSPLGIALTDMSGRYLEFNQAFENICGYTHDELNKLDYWALTPKKYAAEEARQLESLQLTGHYGPYEKEYVRKNGTRVPLQLSGLLITGADGLNYIWSIVEDITERKKSQDEIKNLAFFDTLTYLPNRRLLVDRLKQALATSSRCGRHGAVMFIDLDNFKTINDTLGHEIGDLLLKQVAQRLIACVRESDTVARLGGDEFVILLEFLSENSSEAAMQTEIVGDKILASLNRLYQLGVHECRNTPSLGATLFKGHVQTMDELLKQADIAMYQSKRVGRNTLHFFDPAMQHTIDLRALLEGELHKALENQQFQLHYQIQVDMTGRPLGAEALIRWIHPQRGLVSPVDFISMAEETGLMGRIGQWVLHTACAQLQRWQDNALTRDLVLAVNVSARQFAEADFVEQIVAVVNQYKINPVLLKLELTESMLVENVNETVVTMNQIKALGIQFSLDDFGTGYSSLQYLKRLPLNQLKIDRSFVRDLEFDNHDRSIVRTIIAMARSLDLEVIAEGVENNVQRSILIEKGCAQFQGYLFSQPVPIAQFEELLHQNSVQSRG